MLFTRVCPKCGGKGVVVDRRKDRRRIKCTSCDFRWSTIEVMAPKTKKELKYEELKKEKSSESN